MDQTESNDDHSATEGGIPSVFSLIGFCCQRGLFSRIYELEENTGDLFYEFLKKIIRLTAGFARNFLSHFSLQLF